METDIWGHMSSGSREEVLEKAKELYESYLDTDPVYAAYRFGEILEKLGDVDNAKKYYQEAIGYGKTDYFYHEAAKNKLRAIK